MYLFAPAGSYLGISGVTDANGQVVFNLPEQAYKVRADYLGEQFWSNGFTWQDTTVDIPMGIARVHVKRGSDPVQGANVYLFTGSGSYLGQYETTDTSGMALFNVPAGTYKFRADHGGDQVWSDPIVLVADQVNNVDLNLGTVPPTASISAEPATVNAGESATLSWTSTDADTVTIDQGIGDVDLTGSISVSPLETTTYTVTATGPGGTAVDSATINVCQPLSITVLEPDGIDDNAGTGFTIKWSDVAQDHNATISLYYDTDNSGADGVLIVSGLSEDPDGAGNDEYIWDTFGIPSGSYYIYAIINDGVHDPVLDYSNHAVIVEHTIQDKIKLIAGDGDEGDSFGKSVAIDGSYAVVGAPLGNAYDLDDSGAVYVFKHEGSSWTEQAKLVAGDAEQGDSFGGSVSINGDYIVVGAEGDDGFSGAAYVFRRDGSSWVQEAKLVSRGRGAGRFFRRLSIHKWRLYCCRR